MQLILFSLGFVSDTNLRKKQSWLITWESSRDDYLADLNRPRIVAILRPQYSSQTIKSFLTVLFTSESMLTFSEKIGYSFSRHQSNWLREEDGYIRCGHNPWLRARLVKDLYVQRYGDTVWRQTLHWTEFPRYGEDQETFELVEVHPERQCSEDGHFDMLWYGQSFLEEDEKSNQMMQLTPGRGTIRLSDD